MITLIKTLGAAALLLAVAAGSAGAADIEDKVTHGYADSNGVKIHYAKMGTGPLIVMIHGFPDYWYTWRAQMEGLADRFHGRRHRSARLQPQRQAGRRRELRRPPAGRRRARGDQASRPAEGDHRRPRLGRRGRLAAGDQRAAGGRPADHPEPAASARAVARAGAQPRAAEEQRLRAAVPDRRARRRR